MRNVFGHARVGVAEHDMVVLFAACGIANAQSTVTSKSHRFGRFVAEATPRFAVVAAQGETTITRARGT
jgi:hypothetical protein